MKFSKDLVILLWWVTRPHLWNARRNFVVFRLALLISVGHVPHARLSSVPWPRGKLSCPASPDPGAWLVCHFSSPPQSQLSFLPHRCLCHSHIGAVVSVPKCLGSLGCSRRWFSIIFTPQPLSCIWIHQTSKTTPGLVILPWVCDGPRTPGSSWFPAKWVFPL